MKKQGWTGQLPMALFPDVNGNMGKLELALWQFHKSNPRVYSYLVHFAKQWRQRRGDGAHLGMKALFERVRWEVSLGETSGDFKLNNNNTAFYSRLIMRDEPLLKDIFKV